MSTTEHYDILVFGGGIGGTVLAMDQARAGKRIAMVEIGMIGGFLHQRSLHSKQIPDPQRRDCGAHGSCRGVRHNPVRGRP